MSRIVPVSRLRFGVSAEGWDFAKHRRAEIDLHWQFTNRCKNAWLWARYHSAFSVLIEALNWRVG